MMSELILYTYYRSSSAYRVRIALNFKGLSFQSRYVRLLEEDGDQHAEEYLGINPQGLVPTLIDGEQRIMQSIAIIEYLQERYPQPSLLPDKLDKRVQVRAFANIICCDIQPLNNLRVLSYLQEQLDCTQQQRQAWYQHWIIQGLSAMENLLSAKQLTSDFCFGNSPSMADICLVPQIYNAHRYHCDMTAYPRINRIYEHCLQLEPFKQAAPEQQLDAQ